MPRFRQVPPRRPTPWSRTLGGWGALLGGLLLLVLLVTWSERLPAPAGSTAPATSFSAARAWPVLAHLADTIGVRVPGTPAADRARDYVAAALRAVPGLEVEIQDATGVRARGRAMVGYRAQNVVARLPGRRRDAVLVSSHYDSPAESVGAADAAIAVAVIVELARALAANGPHEHTIIFHVNDAEEQGLLGAHAFLRHRWAADVRAFLNLESTGNAGKAILFRAGPENAWLAERYARHAPHPYGSVVGQDVFEAGLIPSDTDFSVYAREGELRGLDVAFYRGGYAYHTALDRADAVRPGSVQHMGENALGVVRALAAGPLPGDVGGASAVYYDVLGLFMLAYEQTTALVLAFAALVLLMIALRTVVRARVVTGGDLWLGFVAAALGALLAFLLALAGSAIGPYMFGRPHGWFAHPLRGVFAFGALALVGLIVGQWLLSRRLTGNTTDAARRVVAGWCGALLLHAALLFALSLANVGSAFLFLWWVLCGAGALFLVARTRGRGWRLAAAVGMGLPALLTLQTGYLLIAAMVPIGGRFGAVLPFDLVLAGLVAVITVVLLVAPVAILQHGERLGRGAGAMAVAATVGMLVLWISFPYSPARPQRLAVAHESDSERSRLALWAYDYPGPLRAARALAGGSPGALAVVDGVLSYPAPPLADSAPAVQLVQERRTASGRELELHLAPSEAYRVVVRAPPARATQFRLAPEITDGDGSESVTARGDLRAASRAVFVSAPPGGWRMTVAVPDLQPLRLEVEAIFPTPSDTARALMQRLPRWTTAYGQRIARTTVEF